MRILKIHFGHLWKNTTSSTELPRDFCARIVPLQPGVVLVFTFIRDLLFIKWENFEIDVQELFWASIEYLRISLKVI